MKRNVRLAGLLAAVLIMITAGNAEAVDQETRAQRILVEQGMPADMARAVAAEAELTVKGGEVMVDGVNAKKAEAAASQALASVIVSAAKGSDFWYGWAFNRLGQLKSVVYVRYSWSWMWVLKNNWDYISMLAGVACGWLGGTLAAACSTLVAASYWPLRSLINSGIAQKKCVRIRFPAPPLIDASLFQLALVRCRV